MALLKLGEAPIQSLSDDTASAQLARTLFDTISDTLIASYPWRFATCTTDLTRCADGEVPNTCNTQQKRENLRERLRELEFIMAPNGAVIYISTPHAVDTIYRTDENT